MMAESGKAAGRESAEDRISPCWRLCPCCVRALMEGTKHYETEKAP